MGRPLAKRFFGNLNNPPIGGSSVASVSVTNPGSYTAAPTGVFSDPDLLGDGGVRATGTIRLKAESAVVTDAGDGYTVGDVVTVTTSSGVATFTVATITGVNPTGPIDTVTVLNAGSFVSPLATGARAVTGGTGTLATLTITYGVLAVDVVGGAGYLTVPTFTFSSGTASVLPVLASNSKALLFRALTVGSTARDNSDVVKQTGSRRYKITNQDGTAICALVAGALSVAGTCSLTATDSDGGTYWVTKLTAHKALLTQNTGTQFASGSSVHWTLSTPVAGYSVTVNNG